MTQLDRSSYNVNMIKKLEKARKLIKSYLTPLKSKRSGESYFRLGPALEPYSTERSRKALTNPKPISRHSIDLPEPSDKEVERINKDRLEQAKLSQVYEQMDKSNEALDLNLMSQHKLLVATLITALIALFSSLSAIFISLNTKPPVINFLVGLLLVRYLPHRHLL